MNLLSIDLSTTCTGWSYFNADTHELLDYGIVKGKNGKGSCKLEKTLYKINHMADEVIGVIERYSPSLVVIEEIAGSKNRLSQKTLDMAHGVLLYKLQKRYPLDAVHYYDVSGSQGWRFHLQMKLDDADKLSNKEAKKLNKSVQSSQKLPIIGWKHLAARYANRHFKTDLDVDKNSTDADVADSIAMGHAFLLHRHK